MESIWGELQKNKFNIERHFIMEVIKVKLDGVLIIKPQIYEDTRGWFCESYKKEALSNIGINDNFIQDNHSFSRERGTLRGLHLQINPKSQSKLVRCTRGSIKDIVVDVRKNSPTYKQWFAIELSSTNMIQLYVPKGFLHGFVTLTEDVEVEYKVDEYYSKNYDRSIRYDDPELNIDWGIKKPILSEKDENAPLLIESDIYFE